jgi:hypothetical protein
MKRRIIFDIDGHARKYCSWYTTARLLDDVSRCHDSDCKYREQCTRQTQPGGDYTPHTASMGAV